MFEKDTWVNNHTWFDASMYTKYTEKEKQELKTNNEEVLLMDKCECEDGLAGFPTAPELYEDE